MLHQRVLGLAAGQRDLGLVRQVEIIDAADERLETLVAPQRVGQRLYERGLARALHAIEADEEGRVGALRAVHAQARQDEGNAVWGLVVCEGGGRGRGGGELAGHRFRIFYSAGHSMGHMPQ